jgi:hypothetical protein
MKDRARRLIGPQTSPIKGLVKRKNTSPLKKIILFHLAITFLPAGSRFQLLPRTRYFFIIGSRPSGPHQSPIGIKVDKVPYLTIKMVSGDCILPRGQVTRRSDQLGKLV